MHTPSVAIQSIQAILAPAVMVSACALFLLGLSARYIAVITRIRLLNDEKRQLRLGQTTLPDHDRDRLLSVQHQLSVLQRAIWFLRNAILAQVSAACFFVLTSCSIAAHFLLDVHPAEEFSLFLFMMGLLLLLAGITCLGIDIFVSYAVISLEISERHEPDKVKL